MKAETYESKGYAVENIKKQTFDTWLFRVKSSLNPSPGQFLQVSIPGIGECPISNASCNPKYIDLLIRNVGNVTNAIFKLKKGQKMFMRGPYGRGYPIDQLKGNNIIIVAGGTGTAPPRGIIECIERNRKDFGNIVIFLGFRSPKDILFRDDIKRWSKKFDLRLTVDKGEKGWKGNVGLITKLVEDSKLDNKNKIVFLCGPPIMIKFAAQSLNKMGFNDDQIFISHERHMKCGIGKCGHCMIHGKYVCKDGPVFRLDEMKDVKE